MIEHLSIVACQNYIGCGVYYCSDQFPFIQSISPINQGIITTAEPLTDMGHLPNGFGTWSVMEWSHFICFAQFYCEIG